MIQDGVNGATQSRHRDLAVFALEWLLAASGSLAFVYIIGRYRPQLSLDWPIWILGLLAWVFFTWLEKFHHPKPQNTMGHFVINALLVTVAGVVPVLVLYGTFGPMLIGPDLGSRVFTCEMVVALMAYGIFFGPFL